MDYTTWFSSLVDFKSAESALREVLPRHNIAGCWRRITLGDFLTSPALRLSGWHPVRARAGVAKDVVRQPGLWVSGVYTLYTHPHPAIGSRFVTCDRGKKDEVQWSVLPHLPDRQATDMLGMCPGIALVAEHHVFKRAWNHYEDETRESFIRVTRLST